MTDKKAKDEKVYCPRCFHVVADGRTFCRHCGQFIHANVPVDSRPWDTPPPQVPSVDPEVLLAAQRITLPEDEFPLAEDLEAPETTFQEETGVAEPEGPDAEPRETDTEPA